MKISPVFRHDKAMIYIANEIIAARITNLKAAKAKVKWYRRYYAKHGKRICASRRSRYALAEPKGSVIEMHVKKIQHQLLGNNGTKSELVEAFRKQSNTSAKQLHKSMVKTVCDSS